MLSLVLLWLGALSAFCCPFATSFVTNSRSSCHGKSHPGSKNNIFDDGGVRRTIAWEHNNSENCGEDQSLDAVVATSPLFDRRSFLSTVGVVTTTTTASTLLGPGSVVVAATTSGGSTPSSTNPLQEALSGFAAGAALVVTKTFVKYPLDTATVRLQRPDTPYSVRDLGTLFGGSFRGITTPLLSNIPAGALFFAVKDATKSALRTTTAPLPPWLVTTLAVTVAQPPYWALRNPSEVLKTRQQANRPGYDETVSFRRAWTNVYRDGAFYDGYAENVLYALPADVIKFVVYDQITGGQQNAKNLTPLRGALAGAGATAVAQFVTTPLDVVRNRVMMETKGSRDDASDQEEPLSYLQSIQTLARNEGLEGLFAGASPRVGKALLSGAIQFATYEETKIKIGSIFEKATTNNFRKN